MARRTGQIIKRGRNSWRVLVYLGEVEGKRKYANRTVRGTKHDADAVLVEMLKLASTGDLLSERDETATDESKGQTVNAYLDTWLDTIIVPSKRARTAFSYRDTLTRYVRPYVGELQLAEMTMHDVRGMVAKLNKGKLSARTVRKAHEVLRNALEQAVTDGVLPENPARTRLIPLPPTEHNERVTVPSDKVGKFIDAAMQDERLGAYWLLLLFGGLRPSEALALKWTDIDGNTVTVRRVLVDEQGLPHDFAPPKTKKSHRQVVLPPIVLSALEAHKQRQTVDMLLAGDAWQGHDLVFCNEAGQPLRQDWTRVSFKRLCKGAELPKMRPYDLRHSMATVLLEQGEDLKVISERLGHSTITLTANTYTHVNRKMQEGAAAKLDKLAQRG